MKRMLWIMLVMCASAMVFLPVAQAEGQKVLETPSIIDRVMVYSDRALVTRQAKIEKLEAGLYDVILKELPMGLQDDSVRAISNDPANLKIIGMDIKTYQLEKAPEDKIRALQEQIQALEDNIRTIDDKVKLFQMEKEYLLNAKETFMKSALLAPESAKDVPPTRMSVKDYDEMLTYYLGKLKTNLESIQATELNRRELDKKLNFAKGELAKLGARQNDIPQKKLVRISLEALKGGSFTLELAYINFGVRWQASHDVRILYDTKEMGITSFGVVAQNSGEDWMNAELSFSKAQPALQGWLPELPPFYVNLPSPAQAYGYGGKSLREQNFGNLLSNNQVQYAQQAEESQDNEVMLDKAKAGENKKEEKLANQYLPSDAGANYGSVVFRTPKRVDIASDGTSHRTSLWQNSFPITFEHITTPKISPYAYLRAMGANKMTYPILRGNINVFMGSDFIGTSQTDSILPDEEFELTLSVDDNIRVTRKLEEKEEKGPGFLGSNKKITYSFIIKIENYRKDNATIGVVDQIPVSQSKDITVELSKFSDKPLEEGKDGKLKWKFELKPKEVKELTFSFTISLPKEKEAAFSNTPLQIQVEQQKVQMRKK